MRCGTITNLKKNKIWIWKVLDRDTKQIIGIYTGNRSLKSLHNLWKSLKFKQHPSVYTDGYHVYTRHTKNRISYTIKEIYISNRKK